MNLKYTGILSTLIGSLLLTSGVWAGPTVFPRGMTIREPGVTDGYALFNAPDGRMHLVDLDGNEVHRWTAPAGTLRGPARALPGGHVLSRRGGEVIEMDWAGNIVWSVSPPAGIGFHHDYERMSNGNTLILCRQSRIVESISPLEIDDDCLLEVAPDGTIVWEWYMADHFDDFGFSQELKDLLSFRGGDVFHTNAASPIPDNTSHTDPRFSPGNIVMSVRNTNTVAVVDRVSGDIVWALTDVTRGQHNSHMLADDLPGGGNILVFDNGWTGNWSLAPNRAHSRVVEIDPLTDTVVWEYTAEASDMRKDSFLANIQSGAHRQANGNTLINASKWGRVFEVTDSGELVWEYINPYYNNPANTRLYRAYKAPLDWAAPHFTPDLVLSGGTDPDPAEVGSDLAYTIQVDNVGPDAAVNFEISGLTPANTTFQSVSAPAGWSCTTPAVGGSGPIACDSSSVGGGATEFLNFVVKVDLCGIDGTPISHTASASSIGTDGNPGDNAVTIVSTAASSLLIPDLVVDLSNDGEDVELAWGDGAPTCGYRVERSLTSVGGFVNTSGSLAGTDYTDSGAGSSIESYYYLVRIE
jgi:uncharacterized repeat protein (TIGR01451 family)